MSTDNGGTTVDGGSNPLGGPAVVENGPGSGTVQLSVSDGLAVLRLGAPDEKIAVLTPRRMASLKSALTELAAMQGLRGLVITGAGPSGFCAGADVDAIRDISDSKAGEQLALEGQVIFQQLENLPVPTVALIRGACVGGGCEMVLACRYRLLVNSPETKIGLPEVRLGILPGFGGTQRLPRLVGLPRALDIILKGKVVGAKEALKYGLADELLPDGSEEGAGVEMQAALDAAIALALGKRALRRRPIPLKDRLLSFNPIGQKLVAKTASASLKRETKGFYPAPPRALETVLLGLKQGTAKGYAAEARALGDLAATSECKSLVHLFRISEAAGKLGRAAASEILETPVVVIGAGVMGAGIAGSFLAKGHNVFLSDTSAEALEKGRRHIEKFIDGRRQLSADAKTKALKQLNAVTTLDGIPPSSLVIEAVIEDLEVKAEVLKRAEGKLGEEGIFSTNTSSLSVTAIAEQAAKPERIIGMHFFNPAEKMPLVELVRAERTSTRTIARAAALASRIGKSPIVVEDVPGFLVNRILTPYLTESAILLSQGVSVEEIDRQAKAFGMPMGPLRLLDEVGLDVAAKVAKIIEKGYGDRMHGPNYAEQLVKLGRLGKKNGRGFYRYDQEEETVDPELAKALSLPTLPEPFVQPSDTQERLILPMVNEAIRCLDEGVAGQPGPDAANQIDLGSVMGTGFAPFRGGLIFYAQRLGPARLAGRLKELSERYGKRFTPADGILARAAENRGFYDA
ncbi:MAG: 3-hydroxyacyl-CoA dehydrogenase NAD-binding domain-containing protein [Bdellovibrionota bacterium]